MSIVNTPTIAQLQTKTKLFLQPYLNKLNEELGNAANYGWSYKWTVPREISSDRKSVEYIAALYHEFRPEYNKNYISSFAAQPLVMWFYWSSSHPHKTDDMNHKSTEGEKSK